MAPLDDLYPPPPPGVPADLAKPGLRYRLQAVLFLLVLALFLALYLTLLVAAAGLVYWAVWLPGAKPLSPDTPLGERLFILALRVGVLVLGIMLFAFLLKGFFKRGGEDTAGYLEVTDRDQPDLFAFLRAVCAEIGCRLPGRVYLNHEVNAAVVYPTSALNLVVPPDKSLLVGLGLVDGLTLVEFKALLAHELGHYAQKALRLDAYAWVAYRVIHNIVNVRDRWDYWVIRGLGVPGVSAFAIPLYVGAEATRSVLRAAFQGFSRTHLSLRRHMEFNADLVAVAAAGSDAPVNLLVKGDFLNTAQRQAWYDLAPAAENGLLSRNVFVHQRRAGEQWRVTTKNPDLGRPPAPTAAAAVFQPGDAGTLAMWADHPSHYDRERNAKRTYLPSPVDDRPAWLLFRDPDALCEQASRQFYRACLGTDADGPLADPETVQAFIDEERASLTIHPRYHGFYDNRDLELMDFESLLTDPGPEPQSADAAAAVRDLYPADLPAWVAGHRRRLGEVAFLADRQPGGPAEADGFEFRGRQYLTEDAERLLAEVHGELEADRRYLADLDRSVFAAHARLAARLDRRAEFAERYRFHLSVQSLFGLAWQLKAEADGMMQFFSSRPEIQWAEVSQVESALGDVLARLTEVHDRAADLRLPALKKLKPGSPLADLLPSAEHLPGPELTTRSYDVDLRPLALTADHLRAVIDRLGWIQVKSLVGILTFQEGLVEEGSRRASDLPWDRVSTTDRAAEAGYSPGGGPSLSNE